MAIVRIEIDVTPQAIKASRYPVLFAVGKNRIELADFTTISACRHYIRMAYTKLAMPEPLFRIEKEKFTAPWFEL